VGPGAEEEDDGLEAEQGYGHQREMQQAQAPALPYAQPLAYSSHYSHIPILQAHTQQMGYPIAPSVCPPVRLIGMCDTADVSVFILRRVNCLFCPTVLDAIKQLALVFAHRDGAMESVD
jgi:hypothetical protein